MQATLVDALENLFPDSPIPSPAVGSYELDVPRGGRACVHVLVGGLPAKGRLRFSLRQGARVAAAARWFGLIDVPVEANTGPLGFVEKPGETNPHVIRRAPFRVYDALAPVKAALDVTGAKMALRAELPIAPAARPGTSKYEIALQAGKESCTLALAVRVHRAAVPPAGKASLPYTNWFSLELMATRHGLKPWSSAHWRMIGRYAQLMHHARQNTFLLPWADIFGRAGGKLVLNRPRLRRLVKLFTDAGLHYIEGGHVAARTGGQWKATTFSVALDGPPATSIEGNADLAGACGQVMREIRANRWEKRWIQHVTDEPSEENVTDYRILVGMVRKYMPGLPILDATMNTALAGSVDIWCPQGQEFQKHRDFFASQRALGDRIWFYTCCFPGGPWLNRLMDMELLRPALLGWYAALAGLDGFLHWGFNLYQPKQDPFQCNVVDWGGGKMLPVGDTHIVYPGAGGPWSSLRLEAQREGLEDYELLRRLQAQRPATAKAILARAIRSFDDYTKDVALFRVARKALLMAVK